MWAAVIILFIAGVTLLFAELLLPGGFLGVLGGLMVVGSMILGWVQFPEYGLFIFGGELVGVVLGLALGFYIMSKSGMHSHLVMGAEQAKEAGYFSPSEDPALVGQLATVQTALRPAGSITHDGKRIDAVSEGTFIDAGKTVRVIDVEGHRVVCEEVDSGSEEDEAGWNTQV